jgi:2-methylisocitrate lyase-like PEP mutase family enzyme
MDLASLRTKAEKFRKMHDGPDVLTLTNAWDAASALILEGAGVQAIATTSSGIAGSLGYPDGQYISREEMAEAVSRIVRVVSVPVTADMERGYGLTEEAAAATVRAMIKAGAIGLNLEDSSGDASRPLVDAELHASRLRAARQAADSEGVPVVINARTDVYLKNAGEPASRLSESIRRGNLYLEAGADCVFVPGVIDTATIGTLCREIRGPVNILAIKGVPPIPELGRLGVKRVSVGSGLMRAAMTLVRRAATELLETGSHSSFSDGPITGAEMNRLLAERLRQE